MLLEEAIRAPSTGFFHVEEAIRAPSTGPFNVEEAIRTPSIGFFNVPGAIRFIEQAGRRRWRRAGPPYSWSARTESAFSTCTATPTAMQLSSTSNSSWWTEWTMPRAWLRTPSEKNAPGTRRR